MESTNENSNENNSENTNNNPDQSVKANAGAVANPEGLMTVQPAPAVESLPNIENPVSEADPKEDSVDDKEGKIEELLSEKENSNENFYKPVEVNGQTENFIADPNVAEELANLEEESGRDKALTREQELKEGLTETQKENLAIMEKLPVKYPHVFTNEIDSEGRRYLIYKDAASGSDDPYAEVIIIGQDGVCHLERSHGNGTENKFCWDMLIAKKDSFVSVLESVSPTAYNLRNDAGLGYFPIEDFQHVDLKKLRNKFAKYEESHKDDIVPTKLTTQEIIDSL